MKHVGDITKLNGAELPIVDIITGGSPCQDLSVAGKRAGLAGERSGLFMEQIRIIKEMRNECIRQLSMRGATYTWRDIKPRYMVWENVPGAFSSNKGEDFRSVLEETARVVDQDAAIPGLEGGAKWTPSGCIMGDGWSIAWRVHDAQFWGVPQRRKRIALVADFGGATAPEILFERKGVSGDIEASGTQGQGVAENAERHFGNTSQSGTLSKLNNQPVCYGIDMCGGRGVAYYDVNKSPTHGADGHTNAICVETYQKTTGSLLASGYDKLGTQEVMNDMYVVSSAWDGSQISSTLTANNANGGQRMPDKDNFNAVITSCYGQGSFGNYKEGFGTLKANGGDIGGGANRL